MRANLLSAAPRMPAITCEETFSRRPVDYAALAFRGSPSDIGGAGQVCAEAV
jgi:hypothetical protein